LRISDWTLYTPDKNFHVFLALHIDEGITGWGAAYSETGQVLGALNWLKRFVVGQNPRESEPLTETLRVITFWGGGGGP